ncbi:MAG: type II toxin-antitoxin system RelB/DinJ family antitoxin [Muribaculum sp.]|nr:type II toxin-antitoxin system RelB/DinJ family antitoxin [Muribaculum sp.]
MKRILTLYLWHDNLIAVEMRKKIMMAQTLVNIHMDEELKKNMEQTCQELGMNMTTAITIFAKKMTREKRIPFEVSDVYISNE